jgi:DNA-directed RNA polymerase I subunit RPA1
LRGLIQDHIVSSVLLCKKDTFLTRSEYFELLNSAGLKHVVTLPPCILKPKALWSGK